jgi:hypothetical protein
MTESVIERTTVAALALVLTLSLVTGRAQSRHEACPLPPSIKLDAYEDSAVETQLTRLEKIIPVMESQKNSHGFIVTYAGQHATLAQAQKRADLAKRLLLNKHEWINQSDGLNSRLNTLVCGYRDRPATELWVTPVGAAAPVCSPTVPGPIVRRTSRSLRR